MTQYKLILHNHIADYDEGNSLHDCRSAMTISVFVKAPHFSKTLKLYVFIGITVLCWGYSPIGVHRALDSYSPQHIALLRFLIASLLLFLLILKIVGF